MKIQTTEAVRRFNAKVELSDYALGLAAVDVSDVRQLATLLNLAGHHGLRSTLLESAAELGYCSPDGGPGQPPDKAAASSPTKSACQHNNMVLNDSKEFAWKCADCGYVYGKEDSTAQLISDLERSKEKRTSGNWDGLHQMDNLVDRACEELKRFTNWREFCKHSARPGDIANVILQRDRLLNVLRLCVARLEEYGDAEGGTALEIARRELR